MVHEICNPEGMSFELFKHDLSWEKYIFKIVLSFRRKYGDLVLRKLNSLSVKNVRK